MADLYSLVKKQDEKIDDLLKIAQDNKDLLVGIDTRLLSASAPAHAADSAAPVIDNIQVELPTNIATNESIGKLLDERLPASSTDETIEKMLELLPDSVAKGVVKMLTDNIDGKVKDSLYEGFRKEFANERKDLYNVVSDLRYRVQSLVAGQWWRATPKCFFAIFAFLLLTAGGFGYGFFYQLNENSKLKDVEWLYRNQRTAYKTDEARQFLMNTERDFITGTWHERDSIKNNIRYWEKERRLDKTYLYFNPTEK